MVLYSSCSKGTERKVPTMTAQQLNDLNARYDMNKIPAWVIKKNCRSKYADAACILAIQDETACFTRETPKAVLFEWSNTSLNCCHVSGGQFWVAKSLLK